MKKFYEIFNPEQIRGLFLFSLIIIVILIFSSLIPDYMNARFINRLSTSVAIVGVLAVAQSLVFLTRNFDLSLGSIVGVTAYLLGQQLWWHPEIPPLVAVLIGIGFGLVMGAINGLIIGYGRVPSLITTIGTQAIFRAFLVEYSNAVPITTNNLPDWIVNLNQLSLFTIQGVEFRVLFGILLLVGIAFHLLLKYHRFGRRLYAIGSNPPAARVAGFNDKKIVFLAFLVCGGLAGLAGFMYLTRFGNIMVLAGIGLEFSAIAAAVVGGVSNNGGAGTMFGAILGGLLIDLLENSLFRTVAVSEFWRDAILGMLILLAVVIDYIIIGRLRRVWARIGFKMDSEDAEKTLEGAEHVK